MKKIGLTGGIASGKSEVSRWLRQHDVPILDADWAARLVVTPGHAVYDAVVKEFGVGILQPDQQVHRAKLADIIFNDSAARKKLNAIMHPAIADWFEQESDRLAEAGEPFVVWDIPLLIELGWQNKVDQVWVVRATRAQQIERLRLRNGLSEDMAKQRLAAQLDPLLRENFADVIIDNSGSLLDTYQQLERLLKDLREEAHA
ncbi:dephospho-CoA kinase [Negativicoccus succinicivorans]|uniref:dephospho-CoA kinase n=1 Tax=Negativicoccus succinicivorans TaxID=620903 RepID=UPI0028FF8CFD|nr:dephospho-CoA kinase [Negativicoccus succinicivorans]MDU2417744.1 dephospho-CoA kinase [Negativicoccus succinicivorans]